MSQEGLDSVKHGLAWAGCCSKKSNLASYNSSQHIDYFKDMSVARISVEQLD